MKRFFICVLILLLAQLAPAYAQSVVLPVNGGSVEVQPVELDGQRWLFLPAFADADGLDVPADVQVMQSENLRALFLFSDDPENEGRAYIDNCEKHVNRTTGSMALIGPDGVTDHAGDIRQLRGRGNGTWAYDKKPYQFKLEERADLLDTGDSAERSRTWVLLAEATDPTLLHNRITFDLALEMGMDTASRSEHVDLYYDGEYRGTYLLCEKTEIGEGRIDELDFDELIEAWNAQNGQTDLDELSVGEETNRFGSAFTYIEGLADNGTPAAGAYLLEMENEHSTLSDRCYFRLTDGSVLALKNPENASAAMVRYISERLQEARDTLKHGGVNPETGRTLADDFDVEAFARIALLNELSYNTDGYQYSSSFFVLPAGESRFQPGPVWDFDLAYRYQLDGRNANGTGLKDLGGWLWDFYSVPAFTQALQQQMDALYPLVTDVLLGDSQGQYLRPLTDYESEIAASRRMNELLHGTNSHRRQISGETADEDMLLLRQFLQERADWLRTTLAAARPGHIQVQLDAMYAHTDSTCRLIVLPWSRAQLASHTLSQISEATEEDCAMWQMEAVFAPLEGETFADPQVSVNGIPLSVEVQADGSVRVCFLFEDPSYRPMDYYGEDIGLIYDPAFYAARYPEIAAEYEDDPQGLMDYFCDEGMYEGQAGNAFFVPQEILTFNPELNDLFGEDWQNYYWDFLYYGHDDGWLLSLGRRYIPTVEDAP